MLQPATFDFLSQLSQNNHREWFDAHRADYDAARADFEAFISTLKTALTPLVPELESQPAKSLLFRIYRDVRFSKDKTPYKMHFSAYFCRAGKKAWDAGYYLHVSPGKSHFSAGMWEPQGAVMRAVRQEIDYSFEALQGILQGADFRKQFGDLAGDKLRTLPQGYTAENPAIEILKHKSFLASRPLPDGFFTKKDAVKKITEMARVAAPLVALLNRGMDDAQQD